MPNSILRFPLPLSGLNTVNPYTDYDSGFARELTNYSIVNGRLYLRPRVMYSGYQPDYFDAQWFDPSATGIQTLISTGDVIKLSDGTTVASYAGYSRTAMPTELTFEGTTATLNLVLGLYGPRNRSAPFATAGPTVSATFGTNTAVCCGVSHRGRIYYANQGTRIEFGSVGQDTGAFPAANVFDVQQFLNGQNILRLFSVSASPGASAAQNFFVIFGDEGRVLVYEGDNPGSATWNLVATFDMPTPVSRLGFVEIDGDIFVATAKYAYWFRDLFSGGAQSAYENSPSIPVENLWTTLYWGSNLSLTSAASHVFYYPEQDAIIVQCQSFTQDGEGGPSGLTSIFDYENAACFLVYFRKYRAWALWGMSPYTFPVRTISGVTYATPGTLNGVVRLIKNGYVDVYFDVNGDPQSIDIESSWKTPYAFLDKGIGLSLKSARIWAEIDTQETLAAIEKIRAIFDYTDLNAPWGFYSQQSVTDIPPGRSTDCRITVAAIPSFQYHPVVQLGGDGGGLSFQVTQKGETPDPGFSGSFVQSVYGLSALVQPGSEIF